MNSLVTGREPHPVLALLNPEIEKAYPQQAEEFYAARRDTILAMQGDPLRYGFEPPIWQLADKHRAELKTLFPKGVVHEVNLGGNRSSKSERAAKRVIQSLVEKPGSRWWCADATETASRSNQQRLIWKFIPPEWKNEYLGTHKGGRRSKTTKIKYSVAGGFTENIFVLPNGSECEFKFYEQKTGSLQAVELDGAWCFTAGTMILTDNGEMPIESLVESVEDEKVWTRSGLRHIAFTTDRLAEVGRVRFNNGKELVGTFDHPVLTSHGWTRLGELKNGDCVCAINASNGTGKRGIEQRADTTNIVTQKVIPGRHYTGQFGSTILERFQKAMMSTTKMATSTITKSEICYVLANPNTWQSITPKDHYLKSIGTLGRLMMFRALIVERLFSVKDRDEKLSVKPASIDELNLPAQAGENVNNARDCFSVGEVGFAVSVASTWEVVGVRTVYNLKVIDTPEYFANGILVHNCDELMPLDWVETLEYRLLNRNGVFHLTFTPVTGFTPTVGHYLNEARTLSEVDAPLLPKKDEKGKTIGYEKVPRILQCKDPKARVIYFHTADNPFGNYEGMVEQVKLKSRAEVRMRVYGVVDKASHVQFAMFKEDVHVISVNRLREIERSNPGATRFHVVDPCSGRNWFMLWVLCPKPDQWIIYREWPSHGHEGAYIPGIGDPGEWAVIGEAEDGEKGLAQEPFGFGLTRYKEEILRVEKTFDFKKNELVQEEIFERWIDSRYANSPREEREGSTTLIEQMRDLDMEFCAMTSEKRILNVQDGSIDMINERLYYDTETPLGNFSATLARKNEPQLLVTENCPNTIFAFKNWTGKDGQHGAAKDPIDCVRGIFLSQLQYIGPEAYAWKGGGSY